jgi:hypothetical protein
MPSPLLLLFADKNSFNSAVCFALFPLSVAVYNLDDFHVFLPQRTKERKVPQ